MNSELSIWLDAEHEATSKETETDDALGSHTLDELADLADCFELLERVWPTQPAKLAPGVSGEAIGPYTLEREIGSGGMGSVWQAAQSDPIRRRVALKLIHAGPDATRVAHRFQSEQHLLGKMDHPNITRILDAGVTDEGRPWFAMELVRGADLLHYCDAESLSLDDRLRLYLDVCDAIEHAHQKGVIHRDIKPSNVLVHLGEQRPLVKVIDFGLARDQSRDLELTAQTRSGAILGSLTHMSPEQTLPGTSADTRSDVYLLGALLYQLLTGVNLLGREVLDSGDVAKILIAIREQQPVRPSQRLMDEPTAVTFAEPEHLVAVKLRRELDWIVMRAIEKDPNRRYQTVAELSADVRRFLASEPVTAKPPSTWYTAKKYVRRHTAFVATIAAIACSVIAIAIVSTFGYVQVSEANRRAQARLAEAETSNDILSEIFADLDFDAETANTPLRMQLAKRVVDASARLEKQSIGDPSAVSSLHQRLGKTLNSLGFYREAVPICQLAYDNASDEQRAVAGRQLAVAQMRSGQFQAAGRLLTELASQDTTPVDELATQSLRAELFFIEGKYDEAKRITQKLITDQGRVLGENHLDTLKSVTLLAAIYNALREGEKGIPLLKRCVAEYRQRSPNHPRTLRALSNLANAYCQSSDRSTGEALANEALQLARQTYGDAHEVTFNAQVQVGLTAISLGRADEAARNLSAAIAGLESTRSRESQSTMVAARVLSQIHQTNGVAELAVPLMEQNVEVTRTQFPQGHPTLLSSLCKLSEVYLDVGKYDAGRELLREVLRFVDSGKEYRWARRLLGRSYLEDNQFAEAAATCRESRERLESTLGLFDFDAMLARADEAKALSAMGRGQQAIELLESYLTALDSENGPLRLHRAITTAQLGIVFAQNGDEDRGIELMEQIANGRPLREQNYLVKELRLAYHRTGKIEALQTSVARELDLAEKRFEKNSTLKAIFLLRMGCDLIEVGQFDEAVKTLDQSVSIFFSRSTSGWHAATARLLLQLARLSRAELGVDETEEMLSEFSNAFEAAQSVAEFPSHQRKLRQIADRVSQLGYAHVWQTATEQQTVTKAR